MSNARKLFGSFVVLATLIGGATTALAHPEGGGLDDGSESDSGAEFVLPWGEDSKAHDEPVNNPELPDTLGTSGDVLIDVVGRGIRNDVGATTDVWAHDGYAYTGTFNEPCGGDPEGGVWVWDVSNANKVSFVTIIPSPTGSRANDVRVTSMGSGDILVHSNESCAGGPGGFEIYNVDDPTNPVHLSSVRIDEQNEIIPLLFGPVEDVGVHNLFLFSQGTNDYVGVTSEGVFDNFQIFDITDPANPAFVSSWGSEELFDEGVSDSNDFGRVLNAALYMIDGFGSSANRFLHDVTVSADGTMAYLANWDAGLVLLDISDPANPDVVSVAIDPTSGDGEVNSHSVWPSEDGSIVIEGEEDFSAWEATIPPTNLTADGDTPGAPSIPVTAISTEAGDFFEATPVGLSGVAHGASVEVEPDGPEFAAEPMNGVPAIGDADISGNFVYVGRACNLTAGDVLENPLSDGDIAIIRRGACEFDEKAQFVEANGASVAVIANNQASTQWSGFRLWDYSDPANPVLASTFDTACSASLEPSSSCVEGGTYSSHNVIVESQGNKVLAYISWYSDGVVILDITDPYNPEEIGRYLGTNEDGVLNDFWGIYKEPNNPFLYASDRNGGLYVLKVKGGGQVGKP